MTGHPDTRTEDPASHAPPVRERFIVRGGVVTPNLLDWVSVMG